MAVRKKKITKKVTKKKPVKNEVEKKEEVPANILNKQLLSEEMANIEVYFAETNQAKAELHAQEQYKRNKILEKELLEMKLKNIEHDINSENALIKGKEEHLKSINDRMIKYIETIKQKYGVKSSGMIQYDRMTGKIIE